MRIAIQGAGVAGPTLAWWLRRYGHEAVIFEKAPALRTGGYVIDFWGVGYDIAERMGILPALYEKGYVFEALHMVDRRGRIAAALDVSTFRSLIGNRLLSIARSDIAATIYQACGDVETRFGASIVGIAQHASGVRVQVSDGTEDDFDLLVGADGLHSGIRALAFGPESRFERPLGFYVAAFSLPHYPHRNDLAYVSHTTAKRQVARVSLRTDWTLFLFVLRAELMDAEPKDVAEQKAALRKVFADMQWEVPEILARMEEAGDFYFDRVSQIRMDRWYKDRVALIGDAGACVSFLAGEGTGLAMTEAYVLAGELHRAGGDHAAAFDAYDRKLRDFLKKKQKAALKFAGFFAPKNSFGVFLRDLGMNAVHIPLIGNKVIGWATRRALRDDFVLPEYGA